MKFFLDENVAASVQRVLEEAGHTVFWTRDITATGVADDVVAAIAENSHAILVSHDKDFRKIAPRIPNGQRQRFRQLSMIRLSCTKPRAAERFATVLPYLEFDFHQRSLLPDRRSIVEVKTDLISIWR